MVLTSASDTLHPPLSEIKAFRFLLPNGWRIPGEKIMKPNYKDIKIQPVKRITCPKCGELQVKIYPWSTLIIDKAIPICQKCVKSTLKSGVAQ